MKIIWNKVTWYSKLLAVIVLAFAIWLGFYFKFEFKKVEEIEPIINIDSWDRTYPMSRYFIREANLVGYYSTIKMIDRGDNVIYCDTFKVISNDSKGDSLIKYYIKQVKHGNNINGLDKDGHLLLAINLNEISNDERYILTNSNEDNKIAVMVKEINFDGPPHDLSACSSVVHLKLVKKLN